MARELTTEINEQVANKRIQPVYVLRIASTEYTDYLLSWNISYSKDFGSASAVFTLNNTSGYFGEGGSAKINVGDLVEFIEKYGSDDTEFKRFYGKVNQRAITKQAGQRVITINCLDYISMLQFLDVDLSSEGTKVEITNETLTPNYLSEPNEEFAQLFDFAHDAVATDPAPILHIRDKNHLTEDPQYDGFEIYYGNGQVKLGSPLNALYNYDLIAKSYYFYTRGIYAEDVLEDLLTLADGYGGYLFGETSAANVIANHLTETFNNVEGTSTDYLTPNYTSTTMPIYCQVASNIAAGDSVIYLESTEGLPNNGEASINGDIFRWSAKGSGNTLTGIPTSGAYALKAHTTDTYVEYETSYEAGQIWYLSYSNVSTDLESADFSGLGAASLEYFDNRYGRIILDQAISLSSIVTCTTNYTFKTLQATGIELNSIKFRSREVANRYEALNKLREYLAPNYVIRTIGDNKIWANYLNQKRSGDEDYNLTLVNQIDYLEDEDLYTRVVMYGKNSNPTNVMFNDGVDFVTTGNTYKGLASYATLAYDTEVGNKYIYKSSISDAGYIDLDELEPVVYINGIPIDNQVHQLAGLSVIWERTVRTETVTGCRDKSKEQYTIVHTYYYYKIYFAHASIEPSQTIYLYDVFGNTVFTLSPYDQNMDYARGIYHVPGNSQNSEVERVSTASYWVFYSTGALEIDYDNVKFKIDKNLIPNKDSTVVKATFEYWTAMTPVHDVASVIDGRWDTQVQTEFFAEPPSGYNYAIIDLGAEYNLQAIDIIAGFYKPDEIRKFDIEMRVTLHYSTDNVNYYAISDEAHNFKLMGGESKSLEEKDLGIGFSARYLKIILEHVKNIEYKSEFGVWVVAFTEISAYDNIVLKSEATLIPYTTLTGDFDFSGIASGETYTLNVTSTEGFEEPESGGDEKTAYIDGDSFTYTGLTSTSFTGCSGLSEDHSSGDDVSQTVTDDTSIYDYDGLLNHLGDRLYKKMEIDDETLFTQEQLDYVAKAYLQEFVKDHTKMRARVLYSPYLQVGQTVRVYDTYNDVNQNYFIDSISESNGIYDLVLARYPGT